MPNDVAPTSTVTTSSPAPTTPTAAPSTPSPAAAAAAPATTPAEGGLRDATDEGVVEGGDFSSIFEDSGDEPVEVLPATLAPVDPKAPKVPAVPDPAVPAQVAPAVPAAPVAPVAPSPTATPAPATEKALDPSDPTAIASGIRQHEAVMIDHAAKKLFALSPEEATALEDNPIEAIPKLLARVYVQAQATVLENMGKMIPQMVAKQAVLTQRNVENEGKFFTRWPDLKPELHAPLMRKYAVAYRGMNREASLEQMIEELGPLVMMAAKVAPTTAAVAPTVRGPMAPVNGAAPKAQPFIPGGAGVVAIQQTPEAGVFDFLSEQD